MPYSSLPVAIYLIEVSIYIYGFCGGSVVNSPPTMQEMWVWFLGQKDLLEKEMTVHSSILPGKSHGQANLVGYNPGSCKELDTT